MKIILRTPVARPRCLAAVALLLLSGLYPCLPAARADQAPARSAQTPVVVTVDTASALAREAPGEGNEATDAATAATAATAPGSSALLDALRAAWTPEGAEPPVTPVFACAVRDEQPLLRAEAAAGAEPGVILIGVRSESTEPVPVRLEARLARGLWRVDAAFQKDGEAPRRWRMQSVWQKAPGTASKSLTIPPGETLTLRFTETVTAAVRASRAAQAHEWVGGKTYGGASVRSALARVREALNGMPVLLSGGKRDAMAKKAHAALLAAAQAQAICQNAKGASLYEREPAFDELLESLSEISCAAHNLVPSQSRVTNSNGSEQIRLTLTNAGGKTIPLVALGLSPDRTAGKLPTQQTIFHKVTPGKQVTALFPATAVEGGGEVAGAVQFNIGMGTAVVLARPVP